jgi:hypothetical protein
MLAYCSSDLPITYACRNSEWNRSLGMRRAYLFNHKASHRMHYEYDRILESAVSLKISDNEEMSKLASPTDRSDGM